MRSHVCANVKAEKRKQNSIFYELNKNLYSEKFFSDSSRKKQKNAFIDLVG